MVILHEVGGAGPSLFAFAYRVASRGFSAFVPILFGVPNRESSPAATLLRMARMCVGREFSCLNGRKSSPIIDWVRKLGSCVYDDARARGEPSKGIGVVGLCLTGNFALAMVADEHLLAPVVSEPALPFPVPCKPANRSSLGLDRRELAALRARLRRGMELAAFRFQCDPIVPSERMSALRAEVEQSGSRLVGNVDIPRTCPNAHSVFTDHFDPGNPVSIDAFETLIAFLKNKLVDGY